MKNRISVAVLAVLLCLSFHGGTGFAQSDDGVDVLEVLAFDLTAEPYLEIGPVPPGAMYRTLYLNLDAFQNEEPFEITLWGEGEVRLNWNDRAYVLDMKRRSEAPSLVPVEVPKGAG